MGGTNQAGYPWPAGTDKVNLGDDAIRALVASLPWLQGGTVSVTGDATNQRTSAVTFPKAFPGIPLCLIASVTSAATVSVSQVVAVQSASATGCTLVVTRSTTAAVLVTWLAIWLGGSIPAS